MGEVNEIKGQSRNRANKEQSQGNLADNRRRQRGERKRGVQKIGAGSPLYEGRGSRKREERRLRGGSITETHGEQSGGAAAETLDGQTGDSLEKALSRGPGLQGAAAAGTAHVAGTVSGSTSLRESQGMGERGPRPQPVLPPGATHK